MNTNRGLKLLAGALVVAASAAFASAASAGGSSLPNISHRLAKSEPITIVAFGSSSTEGVGASSPRASYPSMLQSDLDSLLRRASVVVLNRGVGGQDADDMLKRLDQDAIAARPDLVILQTGSNDPLRGVPIDRFKDETRASVLKLRSAGVDVMLLEPQWCAVLERTPGASAYRDVVREVGAELDAPVIRRSSLMKAWLRDRLVTYDQMFARDGLHMADGGYALLAKDIAVQILQDAGAAPPNARLLDAIGPTPRSRRPSKTVPAS